MYYILLSMSGAIELLDKRSLTRVFDETVPDYLTPGEAIAMINAARMQNRRDELFLKLLWMTGVRVSEATAIRPNDIKEGSLRVYGKAKPTTKEKRRKKGEPKDGKRKRYIPLPDSLRADLYSYIIDSGIAPTERIFPFTTTRAYQITKQYAQLAGVEQNREAGIHPHLFRHGFAVNFLKQTHNLVALKELLGHTSILRTMIYLRLAQVDLREAMDQVNFFV
jgi:integrase